MLVNIASFIFVLGILVFVHELGHFLIAKKVGIRVERFSLGFPPNIFARKWGETTYCIGIIPLGGYVKMAGEQPNEEATGAPDEFMSKTVGQRMAVILAGPFMNYLLAIFLLIGVVYFNGEPLFDDSRVLVGNISKDSPAEKAGLQVDDQIIAIDGAPVENFIDAAKRIHAKVEEPIDLTWVHQGETLRATITTKAMPMPNASGGIDTVGIIGFNQKVVGYKKFGVFESVSQGFLWAHSLVWQTFKFIKMVFAGEVSPKMIGGPVFIAQQSGKQARAGGASLFVFMSLLSVNLAVVNILPIPVLDGGQMVFLIIEKVLGKPISMKARITAQQVGIFILLALVLFVTYNDILRVIRGF